MTLPNDPTRGQPVRMGDYMIHGLIGEGGMARVYEGEEILSHRPVAVKVLRTELAHSDKVRRQFLTEMKILASLDHDNIVRCLSCMEFEGRPVMVLELLDGWTLREMLVSRRALGWPETVRYAIQIAKALRAAHARSPSVVHRDLKPENVIVQPDGRVKVMDFGIAKIMRTITGSTDHAVGTLQYMSPEQIDAGQVDGRADLFALGLLMWEMLAGRPPFEGPSPRVLLDKICNEQTPRLPDHVRRELPPHVEALIDQLLAKDPAARPASADELIKLLEPWTKPGQAPQHATEVQPMPPPAAGQPASTGSPPPQLDTLEVVESARKGPLQRHVEQQFDEVAEAVSRFGRATSALIVRVLVGVMILPAAAVFFVGVPGLIAAINLYLLAEEQDVVMFESDFETWAKPELLPVLLISAVVFVRACWVHHRDPSPAAGRKPWLIAGALLLAAWAAVTFIEFLPDSQIPPPIHYTCIASGTIWLTLTLSWGAGRITSHILRRLERAHAAD